MNGLTAPPSSIPSTSQVDTATKSRNIIPSEDLDPFQVFGGGMESPKAGSFVLVDSEDDTWSTESVDGQRCEPSTAGDNVDEENGEGSEAGLERLNRSDAGFAIGGLIQNLKDLRTEIARGRGGRHILKRLAKAEKKLRAAGANLEVTHQEKAHFSSHIRAMADEQYAPSAAWDDKQQDAVRGAPEAASNATEAGCGCEELKAARKELRAAKAHTEFLQMLLEDSTTQTAILNHQLETRSAALTAAQEGLLERERELGRVLSGNPRFERPHGQ